jgi:hypothetical protein
VAPWQRSAQRTTAREAETGETKAEKYERGGFRHRSRSLTSNRAPDGCHQVIGSKYRVVSRSK